MASVLRRRAVPNPADSPDSPDSPAAKLNRSVSFEDDFAAHPPGSAEPQGVSEPAHRSDSPDGAQEHGGFRRRPPTIVTDLQSPLGSEFGQDSVLGSPQVIRSPLGGTRHPSVPELSPDQSPLATAASRSLSRPSTIPQSPGTPLQLRNRTKTVVIDDPKALPGAAWITVFFMACHYLMFLFLWMAGYYYNSNPAPTSLFLIPTFTTGCVMGLGMVCLMTQRNKYIRILMAPSTGIVLAIGGLAGGSVWCLLIYGARTDDYGLAMQLAFFGSLCLLYFLLVRRRLGFANAAFSAGGHSVARVRSVMFRALLHAVVLGIYIAGWNMLYIQLVDIGEPEKLSANSTRSEEEEASKIESLAAGTLPKWSQKLAEGFSEQFLRYMGRIYMAYNLYLVSQMVKASMQISTSGVTYSVLLAARYGMPVRLRSNKQLNERLKTQLPSLFISGHLMLISCSIRAVAEGLRRCGVKRHGFLYNVGSLSITAFHPCLRLINSHGICYMEVTGTNFIKSSAEAFDLYKRTGMDAVVNDDVLFGTRIASYILVASASSIVGSILVEIFGFPMSTTVQIGHMCFVTACAAGNWGMEAAESWLVTLYLEFASYPESIYVTNPDLANHVHSVFFGSDKKIGARRAKRFEKKSWLERVKRYAFGSPPNSAREEDKAFAEAQRKKEEEEAAAQAAAAEEARIRAQQEEEAMLRAAEAAKFLKEDGKAKTFEELQRERRAAKANRFERVVGDASGDGGGEKTQTKLEMLAKKRGAGRGFVFGDKPKTPGKQREAVEEDIRLRSSPEPGQETLQLGKMMSLDRITDDATGLAQKSPRSTLSTVEIGAVGSLRGSFAAGSSSSVVLREALNDVTTLEQMAEEDGVEELAGSGGHPPGGPRQNTPPDMGDIEMRQTYANDRVSRLQEWEDSPGHEA